jgi:hypothetical protein
VLVQTKALPASSCGYRLLTASSESELALLLSSEVPDAIAELLYPSLPPLRVSEQLIDHPLRLVEAT